MGSEDWESWSEVFRQGFTPRSDIAQVEVDSVLML